MEHSQSPFEFPKAEEGALSTARMAHIASTVLAFPNPRPQDIPIIHIQHNPLPIQWVLIDGSSIDATQLDEHEPEWTDAAHMYPRGSLLVI